MLAYEGDVYLLITDFIVAFVCVIHSIILVSCGGIAYPQERGIRIGLEE